jgi:DNA-binding transcriptional LysR family regulator
VRGTGELRGELRVGLAASFAMREIIPRLPMFMDRHPALWVDLILDDHRRVLILLLLYIAFGNLRNVPLMLVNVPFGLLGRVLGASLAGRFLSPGSIRRLCHVVWHHCLASPCVIRS